MSALTAIHSVPVRPYLYLVSDSSERPHRQSDSVYRRRRIFAAGVAILTVATLWVAASSLMSVVGHGNPAAAASVQPVTESQAKGSGFYWTVRPGDTLWTIAQAIKPSGDIRPVLDKLKAKYGTTPLTPGMNLSL